MVSGPHFRYNRRESMLTNFERRSSSLGAKPSGRSVWRRVNRTSVGVCKRDLVRVKRSGVVKKGKVLMRKAREAIKRIVRARDTFGGTGRMVRPSA